MNHNDKYEWAPLEWLNDAEKAKYERVLPYYLKNDIQRIPQIDRFTLSRYCSHLYLLEKFDSMPKLMVEEDGNLIPFADSKQRGEWLKLLRQSEEELLITGYMDKGLD